MATIGAPVFGRVKTPTQRAGKSPPVQTQPVAASGRSVRQGGGDLGEFGVEVGAQGGDHGNDDDRDTGGDQTVFNGGGAALAIEGCTDISRDVFGLAKHGSDPFS